MNNTMYEEYQELTDTEIENLARLYEPWAEKHKRLFSHISRLYGGEKALYEPFNLYAGDVAKKINTYLREVGLNKDDVKECYWADLITTLRLSIVYAPRIPHNMLVYRWVPKNVIDAMLSKSHKSFKEYGFLSTSLKPNAQPNHITSDYELLQIKVDSETPAVFVDTIAARSEYELLFLDGHELQYEDLTYVESVKRNAYLVRIINAPYLPAL